jgi:hypothetical protein
LRERKNIFKRDGNLVFFYQNLNYSVAKLFLFGGKKLEGKSNVLKHFGRIF